VDLSSSRLTGQTISAPAQVTVSVAVSDSSNNPVVGAAVSVVDGEDAKAWPDALQYG